MFPSLQFLRETHLIGPTCREWVLGRDRLPLLGTGHFLWVGHGELRRPYRMVRLQPEYAHVVACFGGRGRVLIDGRMRDWHPGEVLLAPKGVCHAFEPAGTRRWRIAWVFCDERPGRPLLGGRECRLVARDCSGFVATLQQLTREAAGEADPAALQALVSLLQTHTRRLVREARTDGRLVALWERVEADPGRAWSGRELARAAGMSEEHLRRLCHRHYRQAPMHYVAGLRMHRAGVLLRATAAKLDAVAQQVGFASTYSFSAAFKRWSGLPPARFRRQAAGEPAAG